MSDDQGLVLARQDFEDLKRHLVWGPGRSHAEMGEYFDLQSEIHDWIVATQQPNSDADAYLVVLDERLSDETAVDTLRLLLRINGVISVTPVVDRRGQDCEHAGHLDRERLRYEVREELYDLYRKVADRS